MPSPLTEKLKQKLSTIRKGGAPKYHEKNAQEKKLFCRERIDLLLDPGSFVEDGALANNAAAELPADGVVTGMGRIAGRAVANLRATWRIRFGWMPVMSDAKSGECRAARSFTSSKTVVTSMSPSSPSSRQLPSSIGRSAPSRNVAGGPSPEPDPGAIATAFVASSHTRNLSPPAED